MYPAFKSLSGSREKDLDQGCAADRGIKVPAAFVYMHILQWDMRSVL